MATIDELTVEVQTKAKAADNGIDTLAKGLEKLANVVEKVQSGKLKSIGRGIEQLSNGMKGLKDVKLPNYTRLSNGLSELAKVDSEKLKTVSDALNPLANSIQTLSGANFDGKNIQGFVNSITRLSNANTESLKNINFTALGDSIKGLAGTLAGAEKVQQNTISMTNAIAKLANAGDKADTVKSTLPGLGTALKDFMNTMSSAPKVATETIQFTQAIGTLANAGKKAETTAGNLEKLGQETLKLIQALSSAPKVSSNTISLVQAISQLANAGGRAGISSNNLSGNLGKLSKSMIGIRGSTLKAVVSLKSFATQIAASMGVYLGIYGAIRGIKKSIDISSDLVEVQNVVDVTFGEMTDKVEEFAQTSIKTFGMSELATKQYASRFQAMGTAMGINPSLIGNANKFLNEQTKGYVNMSDSMSDVSLNLTKLTADMASFYNVEQSTVAEKLASGIFGGQTRPLRDFGLDLTQATLAEWAMKNGLDADVKSMTQMEKTMLRYQYVLANTTASHGDFERTANTWANQTRILKQQFEQLGSVIGGTFVNAFKPFVATLNAVLAKVISFAKTVSNALGKIFGWTIEISSGGLTNDIGADLSDAAGGADNLADGLGGANDSAKKLRKTLSLLPFDQLNQLTGNKDTGSAGSGGGGQGSGSGGAGGANGEGAMANLVKTDTIFEKYKSEIDNLYELGEYIRDTLIGVMEGIDWDSVYEKARGFGKGLANFLNGLLAYDGEGKTLFGTIGKTLANTLNTVVYSALSFGQTFDFRQLGVNIADGINNIFRNFDFEALAETLNVWVDGIWEFIGGFLEKIEPGDIFKGIKDFLGTLELDTLAVIIGAIAWKLGAGVLIKNAIVALLTKNPIVLSLTATIKDIGLIGFAKALLLSIKNSIAGIATKIGEIIAGIFPSLSLGAAIGGIVAVVGGAITAISSFISMLTDGFRWLKEALMLVGIAITAVGAVILGVPATVATVVAGIVAAVATAVIVVKDNWEAIKEKTSEIWESIKKTLENVWAGTKEFISKTVENISKIISTAWENVKIATVAIWNEIKSAISSIWEGIRSIVSGAINGVKYVISSIWDSIRTLTSNVWDGIKNTISNVWNGIKNTASSVFNGIKEVISSIWNTVKSVSSSVWNGIKSVISGIWNGLKSMASNTFGGIKDTIVSVWEKLKSATSRVWDGIVGVIKRPINAIIGLMNGLIRGMASAVNGIANMLNSLSFDIPGWLGGGSFHLNIPTWKPGRIPYLEQGGVLKRGQVGILEGNGAEAVVPLERNQKWISRVSEEMAKNNHTYSGGVNEDLIANAVAEGVAMALMNNYKNLQQKFPEYIQNNIYYDGDVMARAISKAQGDREYRFNPA